MQDSEDDVCDKGANDGDSVLQVVCVAFFFGGAAVVGDGLEQALDVIILRRVEGLEFSCTARFGVEGYGTAAIAFAGRVGADEREFAFGLYRGGEVVWVVVERRVLRFEVIAVFADAVGDMAMRDGVVIAGCACGFDSGAVAVRLCNCDFGCGGGLRRARGMVDVWTRGSFDSVRMCMDCGSQSCFARRGRIFGVQGCGFMDIARCKSGSEVIL